MSELNERGGLPPNFSLSSMINNAQDNRVASQLIMDASDRQRRQIKIDAITGLLKQEAWFDNVDAIIENLQPGEILTIFVVDLDDFKSLNDSLGHDAGDEFLGIAAQALQETFKRETDKMAHGSRERQDSESIARLGGDEFAIYTIQKTDIVDGERRSTDNNEEIDLQPKRVNAELRKLIIDTKFAATNHHMSMGGATYVEGDTAKTLFVRADINMIHSKYQGKIDKISEEDREHLCEIIDFLQRVGARVEPWLFYVINKT